MKLAAVSAALDFGLHLINSWKKFSVAKHLLGPFGFWFSMSYYDLYSHILSWKSTRLEDTLSYLN